MHYRAISENIGVVYIYIINIILGNEDNKYKYISYLFSTIWWYSSHYPIWVVGEGPGWEVIQSSKHIGRQDLHEWSTKVAVNKFMNKNLSIEMKKENILHRNPREREYLQLNLLSKGFSGNNLLYMCWVAR